MSSGTCWHCEADHDTGDCPTRKQWTKGEHQPGSPGVDLDALERRLELDLGSWGNLNTYRRVFAELRTLRARVGELESENARLDENEQQHSTLCDETNRAASAQLPEDDDRLAMLRATIDDSLGWADEASREAGDYVARVVQVGAELAAAREEQGLEARLFELLTARDAENSLQLRKHGVEPWMAVVRERNGKEKVHEATALPALLRAILSHEKGGPDEG